MASEYDGSVIFNTGIDNSGFQAGLNEAERMAAESAKKIEKDIKLPIGDTIKKEIPEGTKEGVQGSKKHLKDYEDVVRKSTKDGVSIGFSSVFSGTFIAGLASQALGAAWSEAKTFVSQGIELASSLAEVTNVVDTTFTSSADKIYSFAKTAKESFGISELAALQFSGTMGAMLKSMGVNGNEIDTYATKLVSLAGDIASFYNIDTSTAFEKIRSGIAGEIEPLRQLGIEMSVANVEAYALAQGLGKTYEKMSQEEQTLMRMGYLFSVTGDQQGDFAKTSESSANQMRVFQLSVKEISQSLGDEFLPSLTKGIGYANDNLPKLQSVGKDVGSALGNMVEFAVKYGDKLVALAVPVAGFAAGLKATEGALKFGDKLKDYYKHYEKIAITQQAAAAVSVDASIKTAQEAAITAVNTTAKIAETTATTAGTTATTTNTTAKVTNTTTTTAQTAATTGLAVATTGAATATATLNAMLKANAPGLIIGAMVALTTVIIDQVKKANELTNEIKEIGKAYEDNLKTADDTYESDLKEISNLEKKVEKYEDLRNTFYTTGEGSNQLKDAAAELQRILPAGTQIVDEQTGAYLSLAGSIEEVVKNMTLQARANSYNNKIETATDFLVDYELQIKNLKEQRDAFVEEMQSATKMDPNLESDYWNVLEALELAEEGYAGISEEIKGYQDLLSEFYTENPEFSLESETNVAADTSAAEESVKKVYDARTIEEQKYARRREANTRQLNLKMEDLQTKYDLGVIQSEEEFYAKRRELLEQYGDITNKDHTKYYIELVKYDKQAADELIKQQEEDAKKIAEESKKNIELFQSQWKKLEHERKLGIIESDEDLYKKRLDLLNQYGNPEIEEYWSYYEAIADYDQKAAKELSDEQDKTVKTYTDDLRAGIKNIIGTYQSESDALENSMGNYTSRLQEIAGNVFSISEQDGLKTFTIGNISEQIKAMKEYAKDIDSLEASGFGTSLFSELNKLSAPDAAQMADYITKMGTAEKTQLKTLMQQRQKVEKELTKSQYADDFALLEETFGLSMKELVGDSFDPGVQSGAEFVKGFMQELNNIANEMQFDVGIEQKKDIAAFAASTVFTPMMYNPAPVKSANTSQNININTTLEMDREVIGRAAYQWTNDYNQQTGR